MELHSKSDSNSFISLKEATYMPKFLPEISGFDVSEFDAELMLRLSRFGGVGIRDPTKSSASAFRLLTLKPMLRTQKTLPENGKLQKIREILKRLKT